jgi:hypothetical protein
MYETIFDIYEQNPFVFSNSMSGLTLDSRVRALDNITKFRKPVTIQQLMKRILDLEEYTQNKKVKH